MGFVSGRIKYESGSNSPGTIRTRTRYVSCAQYHSEILPAPLRKGGVRPRWAYHRDPGRRHRARKLFEKREATGDDGHAILALQGPTAADGANVIVIQIITTKRTDHKG